MWVYSSCMHVARRVCYRSGPVLKRCNVCMHEYNHFILANIGCFVDTVQYNHLAALVPTLWQRKKREKEQKINSKNTASSSKHYLLQYLVFFLEEPADKKRKKIGGKNWRSYYRCTWYTYHIRDALGNHEQSGGGAGCKRPRQRGTDA